MPLAIATKMWPTPNVPNGGRTIPEDALWTGASAYTKKGKKLQVGLHNAVKLWPTPASADSKRAGNYGHGDNNPTLAGAAKLWPTPRANDAEKRGEFNVENPRNGLPAAAKFATPQSRDYRSGQSSRWESPERSRNLNDQVAMFPTPRAEFDSGKHDGRPDTLHSFVKTFPTPTSSMFTEADMEQARFAGNSGNRPSYAEAKNFPTPAARDWKDTGTVHTPIRKDGKSRMDTLGRVVADGGQLNPAWVELLMGWPMNWSGVGPELKQWLNHEGRYAPEALRDGSWEHGVPRVAKGVKNRVARLKALGNGQVPACMVQAWQVLNRIRSENL